MHEQRLTPELHRLLIKNGYQYLLIKEVRVIDPDKSIYIVTAVKKMPSMLRDSCTGIEDGMIKSIVSGKIQNIEMLIEYE